MEMNYIRAELHNHSMESDGQLSIAELVDYAEKQDFEVLAITDHNTASGQDKAIALAKNKEIEIIPGIEITTFYGHILTLGLKHMIDYTELDPEHPQEFIRKLKKAGARAVGIAHPFCVGQPIMVGCRLEMDFQNMQSIDYIEIFNTSAGDLFSGNEAALEWWRKLILEGYHISPVTGIDLHRIPQEKNTFTTFGILQKNKGRNESSKAEEIMTAILKQKTMVTKGPRISSAYKNGRIMVNIDHTSKYQGWNQKGKEKGELLLYIRDNTGWETEILIENKTEIEIQGTSEMKSAYIELYHKKRKFENLMAVGAPLYAEEEKL